MAPTIFNTYHAYVYGTAFWYSLRAFMRIVSPATVVGWFRPPIDNHLIPNDLELYTTWTDAYGLLSLAALLLVLSDAAPLPSTLSGSSLSYPTVSSQAKKPYARAAVLVTIFHHVMTGYGAFQHWVRPTHNNVSMEIGVWGNVFLTLLGVVALWSGLGDAAEVEEGKRHVKTR